MVRRWITPFKKQCFVVTGTSINMAQIGMVMGFAAILLPQLKEDNYIVIDDDSGSWIASLPGFGLLLGNITIPTLMGKFGRRKANIISIIIIIIGWSSIIVSSTLSIILLGRFLQGVSTGMSSCLTPIMIGEYTSPKNRGAFSIMMSIIMATGTFIVHTMGSYVSWKVTAFICAIISSIDLVMVVFSPETPSWLADHGRYDDCKKVFRWLRGDDEEEELAKMIEISQICKNSQGTESFKMKVRGFFETLKKKEFYKPIIIMIHIYTMGQWAGINILVPYVVYLVNAMVGSDVNNAAVVISIGIQRLISCVFALYIIRKLKRRTMLFTTVGFATIILLISSLYSYAKENNLLLYDSPILGGLLLHLLMITVATGSLPLPFTIAGEIFPLRYRSMSGGISALFCSVNIFLPVKTFPLLIQKVGLHGAYVIYAGVVLYCLIVVWFLLPETKDRTLQDIEEEFKGKLPEAELKAVQPLTSYKTEL